MLYPLSRLHMGVLNRSSAYLGAVCRGQGTNYVLDGGRYFSQGHFGVLSGPLKSIGSRCYGIFSKKIIQSSITFQKYFINFIRPNLLLYNDIHIHTIILLFLATNGVKWRCFKSYHLSIYVDCPRLKICTSAMQPFVKIL